MMRRCWRVLLAALHLSDDAVCEVSRSMGLNDWHDYVDDVVGIPAHFVTLRCKRCGKQFKM